MSLRERKKRVRESYVKDGLAPRVITSKAAQRDDEVARARRRAEERTYSSGRSSLSCLGFSSTRALSLSHSIMLLARISAEKRGLHARPCFLLLAFANSLLFFLTSGFNKWIVECDLTVRVLFRRH